MNRRTLVVSTFNYNRRAWNGVCYEFAELLRRIEGADVIAPQAVAPCLPLNASLLHVMQDHRVSLRSMARTLYMMRTGSLFERSEVAGDYDVCLFMCQFLRELPNVERVRGWRSRSRLAVAFILETWTNAVERSKADLALLDKFDHVFVLNADSVPALQRHTRTPVSFLPTGADCLAASILKPAPRTIDVLCFGRRVPAVHERMLEIARERGWFYLFDIWGGIQATDWAAARAANADLVRRSRHFIAWDPSVSSNHTAMIGSDRALTTRYFEAAAGGAIILGSRTPGPAFDSCFDWDDAVVEISPDGRDLAQRLDELEADPERCADARRTNQVQSLLRHDWAYRWDHVLRTFGLPRSEAHEARVARLHERARVLEAEATPVPWLAKGARAAMTGEMRVSRAI
jgi:hypothetical protein